MLTTRRLYTEIRRNAKTRGIAFDLTIDDFVRVASNPCRYCGDPAPLRSRTEIEGSRPVKLHGLDRVDNASGYAIANVVACCGLCNRAKSDRSEVEFFAWAARVAARAESLHGCAYHD
jgi:5-methylcytosine-specific restriction endonuclease McrA